jgi:hypothetical protein
MLAIAQFLAHQVRIQPDSPTSRPRPEGEDR